MRRHGDAAVADRTAGDPRSSATMTQSHAQIVTGWDGTGNTAEGMVVGPENERTTDGT
jgi:hypothetical protein